MMSRDKISGMNCKQKLRKLQAIDFSLAETVLYLDAYPENSEAIKYYKSLKAEREALTAEMRASGCPPISVMDGVNGSDKWDWTNSPWPWETEAN